MKFLRTQLAGFALLFAASSAAQEWPSVPLPRGLSVFDIAHQVTVNALPMRLQGFVSPASPDALAARFRQSMGEPLVETNFGKKRILGRVQGEFYISVQIEAGGSGSRGTIAVTNLKAAFESQDQTRTEREQLLARLLPGSRVLSVVASRDGQKWSRHILYSNPHGDELNRERLKSMLQEQGFSFSAAGSGRSADGESLFFKGRAGEAFATIHNGASGQTTVVLNVVTHTEPLK